MVIILYYIVGKGQKEGRPDFLAAIGFPDRQRMVLPFVRNSTICVLRPYPNHLMDIPAAPGATSLTGGKS